MTPEEIGHVNIVGMQSFSTDMLSTLLEYGLYAFLFFIAVKIIFAWATFKGL